jgi:hypothetical protein
MLKASTVTPNMSSTLIGARIGRTVSPWEENAAANKVGLLRLRRQSRGGAAALDVDADEREFRDAGEAEHLGLEREPRTGGGRHGLAPAYEAPTAAAMPAISSSA